MKKTRKLLITLIFLVIAAMALTTSAFAATGEATVTAYMLNVREGQGMEYTIIDVAYEGNTVMVTEDDGSGWVKVEFNGQTGYVNKLFLAFKETEEPAVTQTYTAPTTTTVEPAAPAPTPAPAPVVTETANANAVVKGDGVNMRSGPSKSSSVLDVLYSGTAIRVNGICNDWYEVNYNGNTGYIKSKYVTLNGDTSVSAPTLTTVAETLTTETETVPVYAEVISAPEETVIQTPEPTPAPTATPRPVVGTVSGQTIVDTAMKYIGVPYRWAGTSPEEGFDCSGLVYYCFQQNGITVNRVAQSMYYDGKAVNLNKLKPGDILLFGSSEYNIWHAGIYVGNGQFIHSPHSGASVRVESLSDQYGLRLVAARRIV